MTVTLILMLLHGEMRALHVAPDVCTSMVEVLENGGPLQVELEDGAMTFAIGAKCICEGDGGA